MGNIPVLNDTQAERLKHLLSQNKIDLTNRGGKQTRLPTMPEEADVIVTGSSYNGPFAVHKVGEVMVDISSGEIIPSESGTVSAALVTVKNGIITVGDSSWWTTAGPADTSALAIPLPVSYTLYLVNSYTSEPMYPWSYDNGYSFQALLGAPVDHPDVSYVRLAKNEGGVIKQIQYGDITDAPQFHIPVSASSAAFANSARYHGHFAVDFTPNAGVVIDSENQTASCNVYIGNNIADKMNYGSNVSVPRGGYVVQGDKHVAVSDALLSFTIDLSTNTETDTYNIYLYKNNASSSFKYAALPRKYTSDQVPLDRATFGKTFYTQLATVRVWRDYAGVDDQGNYIFNYSSSVVQTQFGDVVDCDYGYDDDYTGPFHVTINSNSITSSDGIISGTFNVRDDYAEPTLQDILGSAGHIVQGASRTVVSGGLNIPFKYYPSYDLNPTNVYLYEDVNSSGPGKWKFFAVDRLLRDHRDQIPFSGFFTRIATIGGLGNGKPTERQQQYGDIVDVAVGGSTTIVNSSSIYSSSIHTSTVNITSEIYTSTIYSSSIALEYMGAFAVVGSTNSQQEFIASCIDAQGREDGIAGYVIAGNTRTAVEEPEPFPMIDGAVVYLVGTPDTATHETTYEIVAVEDGGELETEDDQFFTQLAYMSGGSVYQTQYGDIMTPFEVPFASAAGNGGVTQIVDGTYTSVDPADGKGVVSINVTGGGTTGEGGWIPYWSWTANDYDEVNNQTVVELYTKFGMGSAGGYIPDHNGSAFVPASDCYVYAWAHLKSTGTAASAHVVVNGAQFKICYIKTDGAGITIGNGITIPVRAGQSINISYDDGGNTGYAQICMVCYEKGLDSDFAPTISVNHQIFVRYIQGDAQGTYAWKMDQTIVYSTSRSPDYGDTVWTTPELTVPYGYVD